MAIAFFCWSGYRLALRRLDIVALRTALSLTVRASAYVSAPALLFQAFSAMALMQLSGRSLFSPWSVTVLALFVLAGLCWLLIVAMQVRLALTANASPSLAALPASFHRAFRAWLSLAIVAFAAVVPIVYLMVASPRAAG